MPEGAPDFAFHFLRPAWLLAVLLVGALLWLIRRHERSGRQWAGVIAPHLLKHLSVTPGGRWHIRPVYLVALGLTLGAIALAGPTWRREVPPFVADKAPLMIALDVSGSMATTDVPPSRLERAKQKISDLLTARAGARTGLIAYAGTAHLVMPLTEDRAVIEPFLAALAPGLMPVDGKQSVAAATFAAASLTTETVPGTILLITDSIEGTDSAVLRQAAGRNSLLVLAVSAGDSGSAAPTLRATIDDSDIRTLTRMIDVRFEAQASETGARWRDEGYWLLLPIALLALLWFRRGSTVQWALLFLLWQAVPAHAADSWRLRDLWLTPDQQGRLAFDRRDYAGAAKLFADPFWRGVAAYRAYDYLAAAEAFEQVDTNAGRFALGNAQAHNRAYEKAIKSYEAVLAAEPGHQGAKANLKLVREVLAAAEAKRREDEKDQSSGDLPPDETKIDPAQKGGKRTLVQPEDVTTPGAAEAWMREVQTSPADFLKLKFAIQAQTPSAPAGATR